MRQIPGEIARYRSLVLSLALSLYRSRGDAWGDMSMARISTTIAYADLYGDNGPIEGVGSPATNAGIRRKASERPTRPCADVQ